MGTNGMTERQKEPPPEGMSRANSDSLSDLHSLYTLSRPDLRVPSITHTPGEPKRLSFFSYKRPLPKAPVLKAWLFPGGAIEKQLDQRLTSSAD